MVQFTAHTAETAPSESRPMLEGIGKAFGFVPNLFGVFAESPAALRGALAIYDAFSSSTLSPAEQQLVMLAVSEANDCDYCVAAHSTLAKRAAGLGAEVVSAVRDRTRLPDTKLDALVTFTHRVVEQRGVLSDNEVSDFLDAGYSKAQLIDVLLGVGMKTFNNYVDHVARTPLNDEFRAEAWQPKRKAA